MKATHRGECQLCGRVQMLPSGMLAKHGYTKTWGWFQGTCPGSGHLPYELSTDRIASAVSAVEGQIDALRANADAIDAQTGTKAWGYIWTRDASGYAGDYRWVEGTVTGEQTTPDASGWSYLQWQFEWTEGRVATRVAGPEMPPLVRDTPLYGRRRAGATEVKTKRGRDMGLYDRMETIEQVAKALNAKRSGQVRTEADQSETYRNWLVAREAAWVKRPLTPRGQA